MSDEVAYIDVDAEEVVTKTIPATTEQVKVVDVDCAVGDCVIVVEEQQPQQKDSPTKREKSEEKVENPKRRKVVLVELDEHIKECVEREGEM